MKKVKINHFWADKENYYHRYIMNCIFIITNGHHRHISDEIKFALFMMKNRKEIGQMFYFVYTRRNKQFGQ